VTIAAVVLAAGESSRLGRPKQDVVLNGETLLERTVRVAAGAGLSPVIVVVREARYIEPLQQKGAVVLLNRLAFEGMATSIRAGIQGAQAVGVSGAVVLTCDQPGVTAAHLRALVEEADAVCGSAYAGRVGVPAYFPVASFGELLKLEGDVGARQLLVDAKAVPLKSLSIDIDTEEDFRAAQILFER
jgi:molybdenum cofactor cytidylyltransferase